MIDKLSPLQKIGVYLATFVFLLFILMPFIEMIRVSLRPMSHLMTADFTWWSEDFSLQAYSDMRKTVPLLGRYIFNSIFVASATTETLPVKMYHHIAHTIDPLLASISTVLIVLTLVLMMVLDRFYGLDRVLSGKS